MDVAALAAWSPYFLAAALSLGLGAWLLALDPGRGPNRVFAAFLAVRAVGMALAGARGIAEDPADTALLLRLLPYAVLPIAPLAVWFASVYPHRRGVFGTTRWGPVLLGGVALALELAYLLDHDLVYTLAPVAAPAGFTQAAAGWRIAAYGPLWLAVAVQHFALAVVAVVFVRGALRAPTRSSRRAAMLVGAGFALNALFDAVVQAQAALALLAGREAFPWTPWGWAGVVVPALTAVPAGAAVALLVRGLRSPHDDVRGGAVRVLAAAPFAVASALALPFLGPDATYLGGAPAAFLIGLWRLALPLLATYALVRHQLFDIDVKVKAGIRRSVVGGAFLAVFFAVGEIASGLVQSQLGTAVGLGAAVALSFAMRPLERGAERFAQALMPGTKPVEDLTRAERLAFYREQLALAEADGSVGEKERRMLERMRERLGLTAAEAGFAAA